MHKKAMQFLFGDRELILKVGDLLSAPVDVIVNPANSGLSHGGGLAEQILKHAGNVLQDESDQLIREYGQLESGMAVYTTAGLLPFKAVIHAVGPKMGEGGEQEKIELAVSRSLKLCEINEWRSIAFPAISTGIFNVPVETCAQGFFRAITSFWDARLETSPEKIILCLSQENFPDFFDAFRNEAIETDSGRVDLPVIDENDGAEPEAGYVDLSEQELSELDDDDINDWFK
jgi:O-acetyl-ADP-ribose deacetylase (regulator of RNase III)